MSPGGRSSLFSVGLQTLTTTSRPMMGCRTSLFCPKQQRLPPLADSSSAAARGSCLISSHPLPRSRLPRFDSPLPPRRCPRSECHCCGRLKQRPIGRPLQPRHPGLPRSRSSHSRCRRCSSNLSSPLSRGQSRRRKCSSRVKRAGTEAGRRHRTLECSSSSERCRRERTMGA